jgi:hypothetical protein
MQLAVWGWSLVCLVAVVVLAGALVADGDEAGTGPFLLILLAFMANVWAVGDLLGWLGMRVHRRWRARGTA